MEEELCRLRSQAELHRMQTTVIATLEGERAALERDRDMLRSTVDTLRTAQRKVGDRGGGRGISISQCDVSELLFQSGVV